MDDLRGIWAAMPLPWNADGSLDTGAMDALVERYAAAGVHGAYCTGTDGEFHTLELDEFTTVVTAFARAAERVNLPVHAGTGWLTLRGAIDRTRVARDVGIHAVQVVPPFWVPVNDAERIQFYRALADAVPDVGILIYNTERIGKILGAAQIRALGVGRPVDRRLQVRRLGSRRVRGDLRRDARSRAPAGRRRHRSVVGLSDEGALLVGREPEPRAGRWTGGARSSAGDWAESDRRYTLAMGAMTDWEALLGPLTASSALSKICTRAGSCRRCRSGVRPPYLGGSEDDVARLRTLLESKYVGVGWSR